jgi:hypothetical protein
MNQYVPMLVRTVELASPLIPASVLELVMKEILAQRM